MVTTAGDRYILCISADILPWPALNVARMDAGVVAVKTGVWLVVDIRIGCG